MANPQVELLVRQLKKAHTETLSAAGKVPEANRLLQLQEGKATPLWLLGHLANTVNILVLRFILRHEGFLKREISRVFSPDFAGGTPPSNDASLYPAWDEVVALYDQVMTTAIDGIAQLSDDDLPKPVPGNMPDPLRAYFTSIEVVLMQMVNHDAYHRGQIGMLANLTR